MEQDRRSRRDLVQNILILLLFLSSVLLLVLTWTLFSDHGGAAGDSAPPPALQTELTALSTPLRFAVTGRYGRYGALDMTTTEERFALPGSLLQEALGSAGSALPCREADFRAALSENSAYYDFETVLPLSVAAGLVGADAAQDLPVRRLLLAVSGSGVDLYFTDDAAYYCCATQVAAESLLTMIGSYQQGNAVFGFELSDQALAPYTLLLTDGSGEYSLLTARNPLGDTDALLTRLGFNPRTNFRYSESNGTQVITEGDRSLRIQPDGMVIYDNGAGSQSLLPAAGEVVTAKEAVLGCFQLFQRLFSDSGVSLCLQEIRQEAEGWTLTFDYHSGGTVIRRSSGLPAAEVRFSGSSLTGFSLYPRQYTPQETNALLLPLTQAMAIAHPLEGRELTVRYVDSGADEVSVSWLAE